MATYKVAQDVEAEDKLLGPFSFRQFIYLLIAAMAGILSWGLANVFPPLLVIPLPIAVFFVVLALPLRKDQPMEVYLAAVVSFYIKPRRRLWSPDGIESLVEITAPREPDKIITKDMSVEEADQRLGFLAAIADTQGWLIRDMAQPMATGTSMNQAVYNEAQSFEDMFDNRSNVARSLDTMIDQSDTARMQSIVSNLNQQAATPQPATVAQQSPAQGTVQPASEPQFNPYPANMRQHVLNPIGDTGQPQAQSSSQPISSAPDEPDSTQTTSTNSLSPDIINLATNNDLTVETIAREAHRIEKKKMEQDEEVVISLR